MKNDTYYIRNLIQGEIMGKPCELLVAVPDKGFSFVEHDGKRMSIKGLKPYAARRQKDKFRTGTFLLLYHIWKPEK